MPERAVIAEAPTLRALMVERYTKLRPAEQRVASFLLREEAGETQLRIDDVAHRCQASRSAVVRMCQALGFDGYRSFRLRWIREEAGCARPAEEVASALTPVVVALYRTEKLLAPDRLAAAAEAIVTSRQVFVYGAGGSGLVAQLAATALTAAGRLATAFGGAAGHASSPALADSRTAVLVISHRGENPAIQQLVEKAQARGATGIVLTSGVGSNLARVADILLITDAAGGSCDHELDLSPARGVQLAGVYALVRAVASDRRLRRTTLSI